MIDFTNLRIVVWGHKPRTFRQRLAFVRSKRYDLTYIHESYFRAFQYLGCSTMWLDERDDVRGLDFDNTVFFTEDQADEGIPILDSAYYILHSSTKGKYDPVRQRTLNLCNYVADVRDGISFNYPGNRVTQIGEVAYVDDQARALYQPWGTDLLPSQIDPDYFIPFDKNRQVVNYVGTIAHDGIPARMDRFRDACKKADLKVNVTSGVTTEQAVRLVRDSFVSVDIRGDWHLERGCIPCRIWKSLSYGKPVGSNSPKLEAVFAGRVSIEPDEGSLLNATAEGYQRMTPGEMRETVSWIRDGHTFVTRAATCLQVLRDL